MCVTNGGPHGLPERENFYGNDYPFCKDRSCPVHSAASYGAIGAADLYTLAASGTITSNSSGDPQIPVGTPFSFEIMYNTAAPDLDTEFGGSPDPTFGRFDNTAAPPALTFFHYRAGTYEATLHNPADFGMSSGIDITFTSINAIDINIFAPTFFPTLAGSPVSFHADFNRFISPPIFSSDALRTNTAIGPASFDPSTVSLLPQSHGEISGSTITALTLSAAVPEPAGMALFVIAALFAVARRFTPFQMRA
jgi:hypothetical protein